MSKSMYDVPTGQVVNLAWLAVEARKAKMLHHVAHAKPEYCIKTDPITGKPCMACTADRIIAEEGL